MLDGKYDEAWGNCEYAQREKALLWTDGSVEADRVGIESAGGGMPATPGGRRRQVAKVGNWSESCSAPNAATASWRPLAPSVACRVPIRNGERARAGLSSIPWFFRRASDAASGARAEDLMPESRPTRICGRSAPHPSSNVIGAGACVSDHVVER
jgi:hypothetical protein